MISNRDGLGLVRSSSNVKPPMSNSLPTPGPSGRCRHRGGGSTIALPVMRPATPHLSPQRLGALLLTVAGASLSLTFDLHVAGFLVVWAGFGLAGYGLAAAILPNASVLDRVLATVTLGF